MPIRFQSPLSNLCDVLTQIRESAKQYQATLTTNEASTRAVLIDPILRALGWDTANTYMVEIEKSQGQVRADYALNDSNRQPRIIVEAKSLGSNLSHADTVMSLVRYAFQFQLTDVFLTDGLIWHHYGDFHPRNNAPTRILNLTTDHPVEVAAYLVNQLDAAKFWPMESGDSLAQRVEDLANTVATLERLLSKQTHDQKLDVIEPSPHSTMQQNTIPIAQLYEGLNFQDLSSLQDVTGTRPSYFRLPDGTIIPVKRWKDVLRESCKFILSTNPRIPIPLPDRSGKKVALFSLVRPAAGISYVTEYYQGQEMFMYVNYDANNCVSNALYILQYADKGINPTSPAVVIDN